MIRKFLVPIFVLFSIFILAQEKIDKEKKAKFEHYYFKIKINEPPQLENGKLMLSYAQSDNDFALAYLMLGDISYSSGDFVGAIKYLEKAQPYNDKSNDIDSKLMLLQSQIQSYRRAGLIFESDEAFAKLNVLAKETDEYNRAMYLLYSQMKIYDIDEKYCESAKTREAFYAKLLETSTETDGSYRYQFAILSQLCYVYIKCGNIAQAKITMQKAEDILAKITTESAINMLDFYYMDKALIAKADKDENLVKIYFDKAAQISVKYKSPVVTKEIIKERLANCNDTAEKRVLLLQELQDINKKQTTVSQKLTEKETRKLKNTLEERENKYFKLAIIAGSLALLLIGFFAFYRIRLAKQKKVFHENSNEIMSQLQSQKLHDEDKLIKNHTEKESFINAETEKELIKKLQQFEDRKQFTKRGLTATQMCTLLNTNSKYLHYILKTYRNSDFASYLNDIRINYIVKEMHENPKLLQYKIAVLAEMSGFSSHTQFAKVFKEKLGVSPSTFIKFKIEENESHS